MITQHQYLIFEAEFISMIKRLVKLLVEKGYTVTHKSSLKYNNCLINIFSIYYYLYGDEKIIANHFPNDTFNFGEIFNDNNKSCKSTPILKCEIVGDSQFPISIDLTVYIQSDHQTHSLSLILDKDFDNRQVLEFQFLEWRTMMSAFAKHIIKKLQ